MCGEPGEYRGRTLADLDAVIDRLAAAPPPSSLGGGGGRGDHAWLGVFDRGYTAHFYFGEDAQSRRAQYRSSAA